MEVNVVKNKGKILKVSVKDISAGFANALRRVAYSEIPVMAVDYVDITVNNSGLVDEILAHRLAMIPLKWPNGYQLSEECKCGGKGCSNCTAKLRLKKNGPSTVYSGDMESDDKHVQPDDMKIPIAELLEGQNVDLVAVARLGIGKNHAKHQAATIGYSKGGGGFTFNIESTTGLSGADVFIRALDIIEERAKEFAKLVRKEL
ncbi:MAG: DNA-directed RNA polymerase subunit D [Candidatus Aenigmarchaeota archaeon]|nr:DNA-directed RNA polymerase subunit D [Candidatus Aenigmarchaeota archaeon]